MKNISVLFGTLALVGVIALFGLRLADKNNKENTQHGSAETVTDTKGRIAYVNIDSLEANYEYLKNRKVAFEARKEEMSNELAQSQRKFQQDLMAADRKAKAGALTQAEYESTAKRLQQMKESLESREAAMTEKLLTEQEEFNKDLQKRLDDFLAEYNKDKHYDYILSYSKALGSILLANDQLDITKDVVAGMNERYREEGDTEEKDTKKKNK